MEDLEKPKKILILGGGTAGWMTANLLIRAWGDRGFEVTLIEAPDIGIIGVGEGSTPLLRSFMNSIGLKEQDWMPACNATYKLGIRFDGWSTMAGFPRYFHPFPAQVDDYTAPVFFQNCFARRNGLDVEGHPDHFFLNTYMAEHKRSPYAGESFPFTTQYGYHFDSGLLGQYLGDVARRRGVRHVQAEVTEVKINARGEIESVVDDTGQRYEADYFIDCTGFRSTLLQKTLKVPFVPFADNLFNDSAVVFPTPRPEDLAPQTISTALKFGWAWTIPLTSRIGNGYVYSSAYTTPEEAERELRTFTGVGEAADIEARHLKMKVGRVLKHWEGNCLAVGLSQGFIEPLEATALVFVQTTVKRFIWALESANFSTEKRDWFNEDINQRFEAVRDYIVAHYVVNSRSDTDYWRDNANNKVSGSLYDVIASWTAGKDLNDELKRQKISDFYPPVSWHCLLAGYGIYPAKEGLKTRDAAKHQAKLDEIHDFIRRCSLNYVPHMDLLHAQPQAM